jgi:hypothetical protein
MVRKIFTGLLFLILIFTSGITQGGSNPFTLELEEVSIAGAPNIHSFVFAQSNGKWLIIGGRTNGLHGFTPPTAFPPASQNKNVFVIDPNTNQVWSRSLRPDLTVTEADPLRSTNQQYVQVGNNLYVTGGFGLDSNTGALKTFQTLSVIDVDGMINAVMSNTTMSPYVKQVDDSRVRVTGGEMGYMDGYLYLVGGHNFNGVYWNTGQGTNNQVYTNAYKKFQVNVNGSNVSITNYTQTVDTVNFHRRDFNLVNAIKPDGSSALITYGGVFRYNEDLPFFNPIILDNSGATVISGFDQQLNQYTTAHMCLYDTTTQDMHTMFFGGTAMYFYNEGTNQIDVDSLVPFVDEVSLVTRSNSGSFTETLYPQRMPDLLGTNAKFIIDPNIPQYDNHVIKFRNLNARTFVGYIFGGIKASDPNPGTTGMGSTTASDVILKVYVRPFWVGIQNISGEIPNRFSLSQNYPNPFNPSTKIRFEIPKNGFVNLSVYNTLGQRVAQLVNSEMTVGVFEATWEAGSQPGGIYFYKLETDNFSETKKMVLVK